jgi:NAD dependent epimerase/dehydratase family enzyme
MQARETIFTGFIKTPAHLYVDNHQIRGAVNASSPYPVRIKDFAKHIGKILHRPWFFPAPRFFMRILFGEVADVIVSGRRAYQRSCLIQV